MLSSRKSRLIAASILLFLTGAGSSEKRANAQEGSASSKQAVESGGKASITGTAEHGASVPLPDKADTDAQRKGAFLNLLALGGVGVGALIALLVWMSMPPKREGK